MRKFMILLILVLPLFLLDVNLISQQVLPDSAAQSEKDSSVITTNQTQIKKNIPDWIEKHPVLFGIVAAFIGGIFTIFGFYLKEKIKIWINESQKKKSLKTEEDRYLDFIITENEKLTFQGFETSVRMPILLWDIYVSLRAKRASMGFRDMHKWERVEFEPDRDLEIQEAVRLASDKNYNGLIILGDPGAGKSTLLKYFLLCFAKKEAVRQLNLPGDLLPILLPLRSVDIKQQFVEAICARFREHQLNLSQDFFCNRLESGKAIVLLDGLDEVADEEARKQMCHWIDDARTAFSKCPFIVTSRFAGYRGDVKLPGPYLELHMQPFSKQDIQQFLHSWYTTVEVSLHEDSNYWRTQAQQAAAELYQRIEGAEAYGKLAKNPLLLQLIALVHYDYRTVPDRRVELYEKCVDLLLQKWDESKKMKTLLSAREARQVLQPLALWMHSVENRRQAPKNEILKRIQPEIQRVKPGVDAEEFLNRIRDRSGVFVGFGTESYGFQHHSFQEYLTAEEIRNKGSVNILVKHFDESWWREPTLLALGLSNPTIFEPFIREFFEANRANGSTADFLLKCVNESLSRDEAPLIEVAHNPDFNWQARYNALLCLQAIGSDRAKAAVEGVKDDPRAEIRNKTRELLIKWGKLEAETVAEQDAATGLPTRIFNQTEDNVEYILIPGGTFTFSVTKKPEKTDNFYLAKFVVTNRLYRRFVELTGHRKPPYWDNDKFSSDDQPVVTVSWDDAVAYCKWLTEINKQGQKFRLPTEQEWEWAAGRGKRKYPWGDDPPDHNLANYDNKIGYTTPVGNYPAGATPDGLMDMGGNVWEWTETVYEGDKDWRVLRGGSFADGSGYLRCSARLRYLRSLNWSNLFGFRVACSPQW